MQTEYSIDFPRGNDGQRALCVDFYSRSFVNPLLAQAGEALFGGTETDGAYSITISGPGVLETVTVDRVGGVPATNADLATAMAAAINAAPGLNGVVDAEVDGGVPEQVNLAFVHSGIAYTVTTAAPAPGTLVHTLTQAAGGLDLVVGRWVQRGAAIGSNVDVAVALATGIAIADVVGFAERPHGQIEQPEDPDADDVFGPGTMISVGRRGVWLMQCENAFGPGDAVHLRLAAVPGEGTHVGGVRAGAGTDTLDASTICRFLTAGAAGDLAEVEVFLA